MYIEVFHLCPGRFYPLHSLHIVSQLTLKCFISLLNVGKEIEQQSTVVFFFAEENQLNWAQLRIKVFLFCEFVRQSFINKPKQFAILAILIFVKVKEKK